MEIATKNQLTNKRNTGLLFTNTCGTFAGFIIIALIMYIIISRYIPYAKHKDLLDIKTSMISLSSMEQKFYEQNKHYTNFKNLFGVNKNSLEYKGYKVKLEVTPNLQGYKITATALEENNKYPTCNKLVINTNKLFSYDSYGLPSQGCW